jgi:hypothetical protein
MTTHTMSVSLHSIYRTVSRVSNVLNEVRRTLPYITPYYTITPFSSLQLLTQLHNANVGMICNTNEDILRVNQVGSSMRIVDNVSSIRGRHFKTCNEYIVHNVDDIVRCHSSSVSGTTPTPTPLLWIKTAVSNDGVERTREMFEYIWAHKCILGGIVFDIHNFTNGYIPPTMYSYKVATEYVFRNMVLPFEREYGIKTPAIMIDGQDHITDVRHLAELHFYALKETSVINGFTQKKPELRLILGALFDSDGASDHAGKILKPLPLHEYP